MSQSSPVLYSYFRSSCSYRVRIALSHKGINYQYKTINLLKGEHLAEDFKKLNPASEVPVLVHNGNVLSHSSAILEYLEEVFPDNPLLPTDPAARAKVRAITDSISSLQSIQNMKVLKHVGERSKEWARHWIESYFKAIERDLGDVHGLYCVGDSVTLADVYLVPQVYNANRFEVDMLQFPLIAKIAKRLNDLQAFKDSHPHVQPDCPDELRI